jgi:hypothetical protein
MEINKNIETQNVRAYELRLHDIIDVIPANNKKKWKVGRSVDISSVMNMWYGNTEKYLPDNIEFKVIEIQYHKFKWWQFWKRKSKVDKYLLEVVKGEI